MALLKVSRQRQVTLTKAITEALGNPSHMAWEMQGKTLVLRPAHSLERELEQNLRSHGITQEVLVEALRVVDRRRKGS